MLAIDLSSPFDRDVWATLRKSLENCLSLCCSMSGPSRVPFLGLVAMSTHSEVRFWRSSAEAWGSHCREIIFVRYIGVHERREIRTANSSVMSRFWWEFLISGFYCIDQVMASTEWQKGVTCAMFSRLHIFGILFELYILARYINRQLQEIESKCGKGLRQMDAWPLSISTPGVGLLGV